MQAPPPAPEPIAPRFSVPEVSAPPSPAQERPQPLPVVPNCSPLAVPTVGSFSPPHCAQDRSSVGQVCVIQCPSGYSPAGPTHATCGTDQNWSVTSLHCVPTASNQDENTIHKVSHSQTEGRQPQTGAEPPKKRIHQGEVHQQGTFVIDSLPSASSPQKTSVHSSGQVSAVPVATPFIKCPRNTTILLPAGKTTVLVKLAQPQTNVNWRT